MQAKNDNVNQQKIVISYSGQETMWGFKLNGIEKKNSLYNKKWGKMINE